MKLIICADDANGIMFNCRRQSRDEMVITDIVKTVGEKTLLISPYSKELFENFDINIVVENQLNESCDYIFIEDFEGYNNFDIDSIIIYRWNRRYPYDKKLNIDLSQYLVSEVFEFEGNSHEKITKTTYVLK